MISLQHRLQLGQVVSITGFALLLIVFTGYAIRDLSENYVVERIQHDAEALLGALRLDNNNQLSLPESHSIPIYQQPHSGHYYALKVGDGVIDYSRSLWRFSLPIHVTKGGAPQIAYIDGPNDQKLIVSSTSYKKKSRQVTIAVAEDISSFDKKIIQYQLFFGAGAILFTIVLMLIQRHLLRKSFNHLHQVRDEIKKVSHGEIMALSENVPNEVYPLVIEVNRLLRLLETRLTRSRNALGNLAHALKTPLNLLIQDLSQSKIPDALQSSLNARAERIHQLTDRELSRARLAGQGFAGQGFNCEEEIPLLIKSLDSIHRSKHLDYDVTQLPTGNLSLDREDMLELLGNLLDNASKWATKTIHLDIQVTDTIKIDLQDDGPGVNDNDLQKLTERGVRIDEQIEGHGLGLSIVQDIVKLYGGSITFSRGKLGGLAISIQLPNTHVEKY